jgi:large conductance mechanosensitive channel
MLQDFKKFVLRGNVVDLAVAVVIGAAFTAIITALVKDFITPLIGALYKSSSFQNDYFMVHGSKFMYGDFANALVSFLLIAAVVFFLVVTPINKLQARVARNKTTEDPTEKKCPYCLSKIPAKATRCAFCTSKVK